MKQLLFVVIAITTVVSGCAQVSNQSKNTKHVGGNCEGCEPIYESPVAFDKLTNTATLPDYNETGPKLEISGIVYQRDGKTPARDVVLYVYHTDQTGHYTPGPNAKGWEIRNGRLRGWMKTDKNGYYHFYTLKPGPYPGTNIPAHIHITVKEPDKNEYYLDEYLFEGDPFLTTTERNRQEKRGGSGIISLEQKSGVLHGKRDIVLGLNIPGYGD
jgi:protocatechuate 3,4-dioxygenase beta subunit